ncbi:MAG TPA: tetratricopeptide repeat protein [Gemmatimonadales bacterium]|nr:tetratricopeptide repeat protein [Gemmatimonadales bacterium]
MTQTCRLPVLAAGLMSLGVSLAAQNIPKRPPLSGADTNQAAAYYSYGLSMLQQNPQKAADAFYWASRIDPSWAQPLYAGRIAFLVGADDQFVIGYMDGNRNFTRSKEARRIDSLELRARMLDPFLSRDLDKDLMLRYMRALYDEAQKSDGGTDDRAQTLRFQYYVEHYWRTDAPPGMKAELAVSEHRYPDALEAYREALRSDRDHQAEIHEARARVFYLVGNGDSARAEMAQAITKLREKDTKDFVWLYESKAVLEHFIGLTFERQNQVGPARDAYARALQEDLSYYPAHLRLGTIALSAGDTATALSELDLAAQINGDEPVLQATYGTILAQAGHIPEAQQHLHRAVELDPFYANSYYVLGRVDEFAGKPSDAATDYRAYLGHTRAQDPRIADVQRRLAGLTGAAAPNQ